MSLGVATDEMINVILVEDDDTDVEVIERGFRRRNISNPIHRATNGLDALDMLRGSNNRPKISAPYIMLVDINMPRMNGLELLAALRADPKLKDSIAFILSSSNRPKDVENAYDFQVAGYFLKTDTDAMIELLAKYWRINQFADIKKIY